VPTRRPLVLAAALAVAVVLGAGAAALLVSGGSGGSARAAGAAAADGQAVKTVVLGVPVPSVVGLRLDAAKRTLESRGFDHKVHGGGLLGVLDDSNWVVCRASERAGTPMARGARIEVWVERACS
jgi:PASTA domain